MTITRRNARQLMNRGYEMRAQVLNGLLARQDEAGWTIDGRPLEELLQEMEGRQVVIIAADIGIGDEEKHVCTVCGSEYQGYECPRCSRARLRLRR